VIEESEHRNYKGKKAEVKPACIMKMKSLVLVGWAPDLTDCVTRISQFSSSFPLSNKQQIDGQTEKTGREGELRERAKDFGFAD